MVRLGEIFDVQITGEWGNECAANETGTKVLRTTNFTSDGIIDFENVVIRIINKAKVEKKRLHCGDIILEKSGGTEKTPVGRVVFCDESIEDDTYLCNNFTQAMRVNQKVAFPRYVFYFMWYLHYSGRTDLLQNKTTGIRNLQVRSYLNEEIPLPPLDEQRRIAAVLDKVSDLIAKRRAQLDKLNLLVKARFVEMFENTDENILLSDVAEVTGGLTKNSKRKDLPIKLPYLRVANVFFDAIDTNEILEIGVTEEEKSKTLLRNGDLLFVEGNGSPEQIGRVAVWRDEIVPCVHQNHLIKARFNMEKMLPVYAMNYFMTQKGREQIKAKAVSTSGLYTLSVSKIESLYVPFAPMDAQLQFTSFKEKIDKSKLTIRKSLDKLEVLKKALMQQYFG